MLLLSALAHGDQHHEWPSVAIRAAGLRLMKSRKLSTLGNTSVAQPKSQPLTFSTGMTQIK